MDRFQLFSHFATLAVAYALALPIGWNRERAERSAGLRTFPLVALAACGFIQAAGEVVVKSPEGLARIVQGVVMGIGFIGGGAILKTGDTVHGTATAASLWATAAIGVAVALDALDVAIAIAVMTFLTLKLITPFKEEGAGPEQKLSDS